MLRTIKRIGLTALIIAIGFALIFVLLIFLSINRFPETSLKYIDDYLLASFDINYEKIKRRISTRWQQETGDPGQGCQVHTGSKVWNPEHEACIFAGRGWTVRV